jgi:hypothetical protein
MSSAVKIVVFFAGILSPPMRLEAAPALASREDLDSTGVATDTDTMPHAWPPDEGARSMLYVMPF